MAEVIAGLELAGLVISFIEFGITVGERLKEFHDEVDNVPEAFRSLKTELPLTINTLELTLAPAQAGNLSLATTNVLIPFVQGCLTEARYLDDRLKKLLPAKDDTGWEKTLKALKSIYRNRDLQDSVARLHHQSVLLAAYQATRAAGYGQQAAAQEQLKKAGNDPTIKKVKSKLAEPAQGQSKKTSPKIGKKPQEKPKGDSKEAAHGQPKKTPPRLSPRPEEGSKDQPRKSSPRLSPRPEEGSKDRPRKSSPRLSPRPEEGSGDQPKKPSPKPSRERMQEPEAAVQDQSKGEAVIPRSATSKAEPKPNEDANKPTGVPQQATHKLAWTPIHDAAKAGDDDQVKALVAQGADVNAVHSSGTTPLLTATRWRHIPAVSVLLDNGARINAGDKKHDTPLTAAARQGNDAMVNLLLDRGARINPPGNVGRSALHTAAGNGHYTTVELLLDRGAEINVINDEGGTPLHKAVGEGRKWTTKLLLDRGADPDLKNKNGRTPLDIATKSNRPRMVEVLSRHKNRTRRSTLTQPNERWERLDKSPVRIVFRQAERTS